MINVINKYLIQKFLKILFNFIMVFICIGIILSLFEEIEFFKNLDVNLNLPLMLTLLVIPNWLIKLMPFIIFFSAMWYLISAQINKDLLNLKIFGVSNLKITTTLSILSFFIGLIIIVLLTQLLLLSLQNMKRQKLDIQKMLIILFLLIKMVYG